MELFADSVRRDPYPFYEHLRSESPVVHDSRTDVWMLLDHDSVRRALNDHEVFSSAVVAPPAMTSQWLVFNDQPRHTRLRALVTRGFAPRAVAAMEPRIRELARELLAATRGREAFDLVDEFAVPLPLRVIAELFGAPAEDLPRYRRWSDVIMALGWSVAGGEAAARVHAEFAAVTDEMREYLAGLTEARRASGRDDLLTRLVEADDGGEQLTADELLGFFQLLLSAGHETTTNLIANAVLCLLDHPHELGRLRATPELLGTAIEEVLRHRSPVQAMFRVTRSPVELHGRTIPEGRMVMPMIGAANRDPSKFDDPHHFDITRDPNPHLAFGHGIHFCVGAPLSRLEARVALGELLARFARMERADDEPWQPRSAIHVLGPTHLRLRCAEG
jgi:cytochrome P450